MNAITEPARQLPVIRHVDVLICGGGPAGIAAALAAARAGADTMLIEQHGCLGGIWTAGSLSWILDHENKPGLMPEIMQRLEALGARTRRPDGTFSNACDVEAMKRVLDEMATEAGVRVRFHTRVAAALCATPGRLTHAVIESKSGREAIGAEIFVDCTGDGDLAAHAGCGFDFGAPDDGRCQPMSLICLLSGLDREAIDPYFRHGNEKPWGVPKERLRAAMEQGSHSPSYANPSLFWVRDDIFIMMANHEYGVRGTSADDLTAATLRARAENHALIDGLRSLGGVWTNVRIVATGAQIGVREGRRIHGRYTVTADDLRDGARHDDAVCRSTFCIDVHATSAAKGKGIEPTPWQAKPYDIPLRALIAKDVDGLLMGGRCISGDFLAHSSYRVTGNAVALGEAAGKCAAIAALTHRLPQDVAFDELGLTTP